MAFSDRRYDDVSFGSDAVSRRAVIGLAVATCFVTMATWAIYGGSRTTAFHQFTSSIGGVGEAVWRKGEIWRLVTYSWLHASPMHLIGNMFIFVSMGLLIEGFVGTRRFVRMYLAYGLVAGLAAVLPFGNPVRVTVGASGAIMGIVAFTGAAFPQMRIRFWGLLEMPCWLFATLLIGIDLLAVASQSQDGTAHGVHLAGAAAGFFHGIGLGRLEDLWGEWTASRRRAQSVRIEKKVHDDSQELDRILEKINQQGMSALTEAERRFLLEQSEKLKAGKK